MVYVQPPRPFRPNMTSENSWPPHDVENFSALDKVVQVRSSSGPTTVESIAARDKGTQTGAIWFTFLCFKPAFRPRRGSTK